MTTIKNWSVGGDSFELGPECWACEFGTRDEITGQGLGATAEKDRAMRLCAAAPELLHALQRLTHPMADDTDVDYALAVIAKATGGQS